MTGEKRQNKLVGVFPALGCAWTHARTRTAGKGNNSRGFKLQSVYDIYQLLLDVM